MFQVISGDVIEEGIKFAKSKIHIDTSLVCLRNKHVKVDGDIDKISEGKSDVLLILNLNNYDNLCENSVLNSLSVLSRYDHHYHF